MVHAAAACLSFPQFRLARFKSGRSRLRAAVDKPEKLCTENGNA